MPTTSQNLVSSEASVTAKNQPNTKKIKVNGIIKDVFGKPLDDIAISIKIDSSNVPLKNGLLKNGKFTIEVPHDSQLKFIVFDYESQVLQAKENMEIALEEAKISSTPLKSYKLTLLIISLLDNFSFYSTI